MPGGSANLAGVQKGRAHQLAGRFCARQSQGEGRAKRFAAPGRRLGHRRPARAESNRVVLLPLARAYAQHTPLRRPPSRYAGCSTHIRAEHRGCARGFGRGPLPRGARRVTAPRHRAASPHAAHYKDGHAQRSRGRQKGRKSPRVVPGCGLPLRVMNGSGPRPDAVAGVPRVGAGGHH